MLTHIGLNENWRLLNIMKIGELLTHKSRQFALWWVGLTVVLSTAAIVGLSLTGQPGTFNLGLSIPVALFSVGGLPFFFNALGDFKNTLRRAFMLICIGMLIYSLSQLQFVIVAVFNLAFWVQSGAIILPYILGVILLFFGVRRFSGLLLIKSFWRSGFLAFGTAFVVAFASTFLPHVALAQPEIEFDIANALQIWLAVLLFFAFMNVWLVRTVVAPRYQQAVTWMTAANGLFVLAIVHYVAVGLALPADSWYANSALMLVPTLLYAMAFMRAGYTFNRITADEAASTTNATPVDVVVYMAGLASNVREIEEPLDKLRQVTASRSSQGAAITPQQEETLVGIYHQLEKYLVEREPLRKFDAASLRETLRTRFQAAGAARSAFWKVVAE
jgi:hypothetical protein